MVFISEEQSISARMAAAGRGDRATEDTGSKHGKQPGWTPILWPVIWSKKSCRDLHVVSCQGVAVGCHITHGERGWETTGGEDKKESEPWQIWLS